MNRNCETKNTPTEARDAAEEQLFSQGVWGDFPKNLVSATCLRVRLSQVLLQQIRIKLPSLLEEIEANIKEPRWCSISWV
jgi:hypothetical protein